MPGLLQRLGALLELRLEARLGLRNDRVGLAVQPLGEAGDEVWSASLTAIFAPTPCPSSSSNSLR
ncbi:hypothetical protein XHV734_2261 [Xanthomonas hortorum pv. vitians]|nr:hypothetical protein XHV734_2261 [Xanthomonas hortorum pv. vitians]